MYYTSLKEKLKERKVWVVVKSGEWVYSVVKVCFTEEEAKTSLKEFKQRADPYNYEIKEQPLDEALEKFDERNKESTISREAEKIAKQANQELRSEIFYECCDKYNKKLESIKTEIETLIRYGV